MIGKYVILGILFPLACDLLSIVLLRMIIYSILVGNVHSQKATYNKAYKIARSYKYIERIKQTYIINHITKYVEEYKTYMAIKKVHIVWTIVSPIVMIFLPSFLENPQLLTVEKIRGIIAFIFYLVLGLKFNFNHKTKFER